MRKCIKLTLDIKRVKPDMLMALLNELNDLGVLNRQTLEVIYDDGEEDLAKKVESIFDKYAKQ